MCNISDQSVGWPISKDSLEISQAVVNYSPDLWKMGSLLYGIKPVRRLSRILKDISLNLQSFAPIPGKPFLLYVKVMDHSLGALLTQKNDDGHERAIYYLSRTLIRAESRYNPIEKECLAIVIAIQNTRYYLVDQTIHVIFRVNPLRILVTKSGSLNSRLAKWAILLS